MITRGKSEKIYIEKFATLGAEVFYSRIAYRFGDLRTENRQEIKLKLARRLSTAMGAERISPNGLIISNDLVLSINSGYLGQPTLQLLGGRDFSISFSYCPDEVWGALSTVKVTCGIDITFPLEFKIPYPFQRAFGDRELELLSSVNNFSLSEAAAFVWSAKESFVKAFGIGFNMCDPLDLFLTAAHPCKEYFQVHFSVSLRLRSKLGIQGAIPVQTMTRPEGNGFLSLSVAKLSGCLDWYQSPKSAYRGIAG